MDDDAKHYPDTLPGRTSRFPDGADAPRPRPPLARDPLAGEGEWRKRPLLDPYASDAPTPTRAALLTLAFSGLGQLANGRPVRAFVAVVLPAVLLGVAARLDSPVFYIIAFGAGVCTAPLPVTLAAALLGWVPVTHPAFWMGLPVKAALTAEAALDAWRTQRWHRPVRVPPWGHRAYTVTTFALLLVWMVTTGMATVRQPAMNPLLEPGDHVLVDRLAYGLQVPGIGWRIGGRLPRRGDVVAVVDPGERGQLLARRVVAVPGDRVSFAPVRGAGGVFEPRLGLEGAEPLPVPRVPWLGPCVYPEPAPAKGRRARKGAYARCHAFLEVVSGHTFIASYAREAEGVDPAQWKAGEVPSGHVYLLADQRAVGRDSRHFGPVKLRRVRGRVRRVLWSSDPAEGIRWHRMGRAVTDRR